jgi:hypothetical protein
MLNDLTIARLGPAVAQLKRIADCLEVLIYQQYGIPMTPTPKPAGGDESDVLYTTDDQNLRQELRDFMDNKKRSDVVDVEDYPT